MNWELPVCFSVLTGMWFWKYLNPFSQVFSVANNHLRGKGNTCYSLHALLLLIRLGASFCRNISTIPIWQIDFPKIAAVISPTPPSCSCARGTLSLPHQEMQSDVHTAIFKMDNQQGLTVQRRELCSMLWGSLDGRGAWRRMVTCIYMAESLCCPPETITTLLIGFTSI